MCGFNSALFFVYFNHAPSSLDQLPFNQAAMEINEEQSRANTAHTMSSILVFERVDDIGTGIANFLDFLKKKMSVLAEPMKVVFTVDDCSNMLHSQVIDSKSKANLMQAFTDIELDYRRNDHKLKDLRAEEEDCQ
jgi:hypothetical protein